MKIDQEAASNFLDDLIKQRVGACKLLGKIYDEIRVVEINCEKDEFLSTLVKNIKERIEKYYENEIENSIGMMKGLLEKDKNLCGGENNYEN